MANADAAFGLRPVGNLDGSPYNGGTIRCVIPAGDGTATFIGDPVKLNGDATTAGDGSGTYPQVIQATADAEIFGVVTGFEAAGGGTSPNLDNQYRAASTLRYCQVVPALDNLFAIQADEDIVTGDIGNSADFVNSLNVITAGSTVTGLSGAELDSSDVGTGANMLILGVYNAPDNDLASNNPIVIVRLNESSLRGDGTAV